MIQDEATLRKVWEELGRYSGPPQGLLAFVEGIYRATEMRAAATYDDRKATALFTDFVRNGTWQCRRSSSTRRCSQMRRRLRRIRG